MKNTPTLPKYYEHAQRCVNLRPAISDPDALVPTGTPATVAESPWRCLGHFPHNDNKITQLFYHDGQLLARTYTEGDTPPEPYSVTDSLPANPTGCITSREGFTLLTEGDPVTLHRDGGLLRALPPCGVNDFPAITSITTGEVSLQFNSGAFKLSREYSALPEHPDSADARTISSQISKAIQHTADRATMSGLFTAPVLFRYRLVGAGGRILFSSVPRLHVPSGRHAPESPLTLYPDGKDIPQATGSIEGFNIEVNIPAVASQLVRSKVERIELQLSRQLHIPINDFIVLSQFRRENGAATLGVYIPRYASHSTLEQEVRKILESPDLNFTTARTLYNPFVSGNAMRLTISPIPVRIADEKTITAGKSDPLLSLLGYHNYGATVGVNDAGRSILANIHLMRYRGASLPYFINTGDSLDNIETVVTVTLDSGEKIVSSRYTRSEREVFLSPLLVYPDPSARKIELQLCDSSGTNRYASFPLTPVGQSLACYISPGLQPIPLINDDSTPDFSIPLSTGYRASWPGTVLTLENGNPLSAIRTGPGAICAIKPVGNPSSSAWEASRSRFHILSTDGIFALSLNDGKLQTPRRLDSRPVLRADASAIISTAAGNVHYAIAGGDLVEIGSNRVRTVKSGITENIVAPLSRHGEILLIPTAGSNPVATVMHLSSLIGWSTRNIPAASHVFSDATTCYLTTAESILDLNDEIPLPVKCRYQHELKVIRSYPHGIPDRIKSLYIDLNSRNASGDITLTAGHDPDQAEFLSGITINGPINAPLCHHLLVPRRHRLWLTLRLTLHPDSHYYPTSD